MEELNKQVLSGFNIRARSITKSRLSYICKTEKGLRLIQKTQASEDKLNFAHSLKKHLEKNNFNIYDKFYISEQNTPYYILDKEKYIMTDYTDYVDSNFSDNTEIKNIISVTANFHKLSKNTEIPKDKITYGADISDKFKKELTKLKNIKKSIGSRSSLSDFDVLFLKNYDYFYKTAEEAYNILKSSDYSKMYTSSQKSHLICHNALKEETVIRSKINFGIINFENITVNHYILDLADILSRYIRKHTPPIIEINDLIEEYAKINPISESELTVLYAILKFPSKYIKICNDFYAKGLPFTPNSVIAQLNTIIKQKDISKKYIDTLKLKP